MRKKTEPTINAVHERHDVAVYATSSGTAGFYDNSLRRAGGAERQVTLIARLLAERGLRVAHITYEPLEPTPLDFPLTLVYRDAYRGGRRAVGATLEASSILRAVRRANAGVVLVRSASPAVAVVALYCKLSRRRLIFSSSNVSDFTLETMPARRDRALYRLGVTLADVVVVQSEEQVGLARSTFPGLRQVVVIPSVAEATPEPIPSRPGEVFLWFGRSVAQKQPLLYVELARSLPEARFVMVPVPDGSTSSLLARIQAEAADVPNLEVLEPLPHKRLQAVIAESVAVVNTSSLEGMPNAFLEAWAQGIPVLTLQFDPDGIVRREGLGIAAAGSWLRFVEGARDLWATRANRRELSRRVHAHVERVHSPNQIGDRWHALIQDIGQGPRARAYASWLTLSRRPPNVERVHTETRNGDD